MPAIKMTKKSFGHGGARPGAGRKKEDPAILAARNPRVGRRLLRERAEQSGLIELDTLISARLLDAALPPQATERDWQNYFYVDRARLWLAWRDQREDILQSWIAQRPGTRPSCWWDFDAPRQALGVWPGCYYDGKLALARTRVGGAGTPAFEVLAYVPQYEFGLPTRWLDDWSIAHHAGSDFPPQPFDRADPPRFESQASYLKRLGLFAPGEAARLSAQDFEPEALPEQFWPLQREESK